MNSYFKCFILTFIISSIIIIVFLVWVLLRAKNVEGISYNIRFIRPKLRNCDLVAFDSSNFINSVIKWSIGSNLVHLGMIWIDKGSPFVIEAVNYHEDPWHGIIKIPLDSWLKVNRKRCCVWIPYEGKSVSPESVERSWEYWKFRVKFDLDFSGILDVFIPQRWHNKYKYDDHYVFCFEFVAIMLQDLGVLDRKWTPHSYSLNRILKSSRYGEKIIVHL